MTTEHTPTPCGTQKRHPFSYTIGEGPYQFVGSFDFGQVIAARDNGNISAYENGMASLPKLEAGCGTCSHCGHGILNIMIIKRGDGKLYGVGSDCVLKVAKEGDVSAVSKMEREIRQAAKQKRRAKEENARASLKPEYEAALIVLERGQHPNEHFAKQGKTLADYYRFCSKNSKNMKQAIKDAAALTAHYEALAKARGE